MANNKSLAKAKTAKADEFYTRLTDIEKELKHYKEHFENKVVFCNCDDPEYSNFWKYFSMNFDFLKLKKLIATHFETDKKSYMLEMFRDEAGVHTAIHTLTQNGDFRSPESIALLKTADIVVTNPPYSMFKEYMAQLFEYEKKFLILGNPQALKYKEIFPLFMENKLWIGYKTMSSDMYFHVPDSYKKWLVENKKEGSGYKIVDNEVMGRTPAVWYTNLDITKRHEKKILYKKYNENDYKKYDNYDAIEVGAVDIIPMDYYGNMGVPISFMDSINPEQFDIVGSSDIPDTLDGITELGEEWIAKYKSQGGTGHYTAHMKSVGYSADGKNRIIFSRLIIRNKKQGDLEEK